MTIDSAAFRELIFDLIRGDYIIEGTTIPESNIVKSEFAEGSYCDRAYARAMDAYSSLCTRLNVEEWNDEDVEVIIDELLGIGKHLSLRMFEYGVLFARREVLNKERNHSAEGRG